MDSDHMTTRLNSKNYAIWAFQFRTMIEGKGFLGFLDGTTEKPTVPPSSDQELSKWLQTDARVRSLLLNSVDPTILLGLRLLSSAAAMWKSLADTYACTSNNRQFELEVELAALHQGNLDVASYFNAARLLWTEQDLLSASLLSQPLPADAHAERTKIRLIQFLMRLRPEFEPVRATLLNQEKLQVEGVLGSLIREETRLRTQANLDARPGQGDVSAFSSLRIPGAAGHSFGGGSVSGGDKISAGVNDAQVFAAYRPQFQRPNLSDVECHHCREKGHTKKYCRARNFCVYCKRKGHIIADCRTLQRHMNGGGLAGGSIGNSAGFRSSSSAAPTPPARPVYATQPPPVAAPTSDGILVTSAALEQMVNKAISSAFASLQISGKLPTWILDSACFNHMTSNSSVLMNVSPIHDLSLQVADGTKLRVSGIGSVEGPCVRLPATMHVPRLVPNLVSVGQLTEQGCRVVFAPSGCVIQDLKTGRELGRGSKRGRIFELDKLVTTMPTSQPSSSSSSSTLVSRVSPFPVFSSFGEQNFQLWHSRLGHPNSRRLETMFRQNLFGKTPKLGRISDFTCTSCVEAKTTQISFPSSSTVIHEPFHLIHTDLWGPSRVTSRHGYKYFALFIDHATRYTWVYFLRLKSDLLSVATEFLNMIQTQFDRTVRVVRSDPGGEFSSSPLLNLYKSRGILTHKSCPGVSQQNGLVERKNRHVLEVTRALLLASHVPTSFWPEAVSTAVRLINYQITPVLDQNSPFHRLFSKPPPYSRLRIFGCLCFVLLPRSERTKLTSKTARCAFLGYSDVYKGYLCYDPILKRLRIACNVVFVENVMFYSPSESSPPLFDESLSLPSFSDDDDDDDIDVDPTPEAPSPPVTPSSSPPPLRRSNRSTLGQPPIRHQDYVSYSAEAIPIPTRFSQAQGDPNWDGAMNAEFAALDANKTWSIVPRPPPPTPVIGSRWVYTLKFLPDGTLERYRARVVAQGYSQEYGIDFEETFAPVAKMVSVRSLLAVASIRQWPLYQLDVKNAFLHGDLKETVYMEIPPGYPHGNRANQVCLLHRSLYGLKQAPRAWFEKFQSTILSLGFQQSLNDPSLFTRRSSRGLVVLLLYVDDMIVSGDDAEGISALTKGLHESFSLKELGSLSYFLGLEVHRSSKGILLSQQKYIDDLLDSSRFSDCTPVSTPMELHLKLGRETGTLLSDGGKFYRSIVGSLIYLTSTRPDIAYAVQIVSQFMSAPRSAHMDAVHRILRYLQGTRSVGLFLPANGSFVLQAFSDSDYAGCIDTRRSTSGWCIRLGDSFISWRCKKQDRVSKSSTEAEYRAMSEVTSELEWLRRLLGDLGVVCEVPMQLYVDNTSAIRIATNPVLHDRTKHIEVHVHYIRDLVNDGTIRVSHITSEDQIADLLTKAFTASRHSFLAGKLMMRDLHQFGGGC
ncbi:unnamed protein product [Linum trigynum]|uniref:Integrase catalytic domain-containing protein n=1 Tax=Linum trigynum TaxID=586398 RepID=A0AAV2C7L0_9ROSI